jgi:hypothetical protein
MQIIFEENLVETLRQRYILLELDTIIQPAMTKPITLHALIENIDFLQLEKFEQQVQEHQQMVKEYKGSNWLKSQEMAHDLKGSWHGELDEFYQLVIDTADQMLKTNSIWDGIRKTTPIE